MKDLNWKLMFKESDRMSFTNIVESRIDIVLKKHSKTFLLQPTHHAPLLINFWPKMRNEPNQNIGVSRLIKKLM